MKESFRKILGLPAPLFSYNINSRKGTILAQAGEGFSVKESAANIKRDCCPSCTVYEGNSGGQYAICDGMDDNSCAANILSRTRSHLGAKTEVIFLFNCRPEV